MKRRASAFVLAVLFRLFVPISSFAQEIPAGTQLPVQLDRSVMAGKSRGGEQISGTLMQAVELGAGEHVPRGAKLEGHMIESQAASDAAPARLVLAFESIHLNGRVVPLQTSLRALASMSAVFQAQLATNMIDDFGSSIHDWNTTQVGGQGVYRGDGIVMSGPSTVARANTVGEVTGKPMNFPRSPCIGDGAADRDQSFWVFSTDACGVYGFEDLKLVHDGRTPPEGRIVLESHGKLEIRSGSDFLLIVLPGAPTS